MFAIFALYTQFGQIAFVQKLGQRLNEGDVTFVGGFGHEILCRSCVTARLSCAGGMLAPYIPADAPIGKPRCGLR